MPGSRLEREQQRRGQGDHHPEGERDGVDAQVESGSVTELPEGQLERGADGEPDRQERGHHAPSPGGGGDAAEVETGQAENGDHGRGRQGEGNGREDGG